MTETLATLLSWLPRPLVDLLRAVRPRPMSLEKRLADFPTDGLPLERPVTIRWNRNHVPFIEAETDRDAAVAIGLVHGHLRSAQISLFKRFFYGRLSELAGPVAFKFDHLIRILDYGRAADELERKMPESTRTWVQGYVDGLNAQQAHMQAINRWPPEFGVLGIKPEPYVFRDILVGARFGGTDFTWLTYFPLLAARGQPGFAELWNRTLEAGELPTASTRPHEAQGEFEDLLLGTGRNGSNSMVVAPHRSATGAALIASDPHLGLSLPNLWVLLGVRSPSYNVVGITIVGLPVWGLGRNPDLAWGGTNLRAASSDLFDVSQLPESEIEETETVIKVRGWRSQRRKLRRTRFGPIVTDAKMVKTPKPETISLRWIGHEPTDEFTALLRAARASTPDAFREAFFGYGVSGQNMLFADRNGNIGRVMAVTQPLRLSFPKDDPVLDATDPQTHWQGNVDVRDFPFTLNPERGIIASANEKPEDTDVPIGITFGTDERVRRLYELLDKKEPISIAVLQQVQIDTFAPDAAQLSGTLADLLLELPGVADDPFYKQLRAWDGDYAAESSGALAFEVFLYHLVTGLYGAAKASDLPELYSQWSYLTTFLLRDLEDRSREERETILRWALQAGARDASRFCNWGDMHRLQIGTSLARFPYLGRIFVIRDLASGGSRQTPMKMSHGLERGRHNATFGSMARHISDLSDEDSNWFALLGGQDGWIGSSTFIDQLQLWQDRRYIRMPLRPATVAKEFPNVMTLTPRG
ncbi:penicillin acylase family protein [Defluviicoccus vanus]|uniref:Penicillin acylase family protein n=1 Tax=Defluviicoccus vanus TaxID=111831 RepID=A0A7H1MYZ6_9PROT|nr:penicillin acylase family protein [Defluviicoccus vanus]QNT68682.1 penicillin acylase family protein [Defluviicoccus vanus]